MAKLRPLLTSLVALLACCMHSIQGDDVDQRPVVTLPRIGTIIGRVRQSVNGTSVNVFLGIPYAKPPVGDLRFMPPEGLEYSNVTLEADKMPPACPQHTAQPLPWYDMDPGQSEDCLYLNIFAPADIGEKKRPVKLYVHGGGWFDAGSNRMPYYDGFGEATDTMDEDGNSKKDGIVVVTVNYRLGVLGFLSTYTKYAGGNMGLEDIGKACEFIQRNIEYFGGDSGTGYTSGKPVKDNYMIVEGQGSGAILVSLLRKSMTYPFRMVLNGATSFTLDSLEGVDWPGDSRDNNWRLAEILAKVFGCESLLINLKSAISCLRGVEASRLVKATACLSRGRGPPNVFLPYTYRSYNPYFVDVYSTVTDKEYYNITLNGYDTLTTFTSDEGSALLTTTFPKVFGVLGEKDIPLSAACAKKVARRFLKKFPETVADELLGELDKEPTVSNRDKVVQAFGDAYFYCPMVFYVEELKRIKKGGVEFIKAHLLEKQVYPPYNPWASWMGSVGFNNVQIDFVHPDGLTVNNKTYKYTDEQSEQVRTNQEILRSFMTNEELPFSEFTLEDPAYGLLKSDGKLSDEKKSNFHSRNCEILRPHFRFVSYDDYAKRLLF